MEYYEKFAAHAFENTTQSVLSHCVLLKPSGAPVPCSFCFSIRRDIFDLPNMIIGRSPFYIFSSVLATYYIIRAMASAIIIYGFWWFILCVDLHYYLLSTVFSAFVSLGPCVVIKVKYFYHPVDRSLRPRVQIWKFSCELRVYCMPRELTWLPRETERRKGPGHNLNRNTPLLVIKIIVFIII